MSKRAKKLLAVTTGADVAAWLRGSPNAEVRQSGSHVTATCRDTDMRVTVADHHRELAPGLRRDIIRAITASGFLALVVVMAYSQIGV